MKKHRGFTLIEVLIIIALIGTLLASGVPLLGRMLSSNRIAVTMNKLSGNITYARNEAITRSTCVSLLPLNAVSWSLGWTVFVDGNCNGAMEANDTPLRIVDDLNIPAVTIVPIVNLVIYNSLGGIINPDGSPAAANNFTMTDISDPGNPKTTILSIATTGHVSVM